MSNFCFSSERDLTLYESRQNRRASDSQDCSATRVGVRKTDRKPKRHISGKLNQCARNKSVDEALRILRDEGENFDRSMFNIVLSLVVDSVDRFEDILRFMDAKGVGWDTSTVAIIASHYSRHMDPMRAWCVLNEFEGMLRLRCYTPVIKALSETKECDMLLEVFQHMDSRSVKPTDNEYIYLLEALCFCKKESDILGLLSHISKNIDECSTLLVETLQNCFESLRKSNGLPGWRCEISNVDHNGICNSNGKKLESFRLSKVERAALQSSIRSLCPHGRIWDAMVRRLDGRTWNVVVDGANVGMTDGKNFNVLRLMEVVLQLERMGKNVLVVLHMHHKRRCRSDEPRIQSAWKYLNRVVFTPEPTMNDDWCWLYAAIVHDDCLLVSNDLMKDHTYLMSAPPFFDKWKDTHCIGFVPAGRFDITLLSPLPYARTVQTNKECWFFPCIESDKWLCVCPIE